MRYGINFGASPIPDNIVRKWRIMHSTRNAHIQGACNSQQEADSMRVQMDNGRRGIRIDNITVGPKRESWFCIVETW